MKEIFTQRDSALGGVRRRWKRVALVLAGLLALYGVANFTAHHVADSLTLTVTRDDSQRSATGIATTHQTVFTITITDGAKARAIQSLLNNVRLAPFRTSFVSCPGSAYPYLYDFQFSFLGLPVQGTQFRMVVCQLWHMTTLGLPSPISHMIPTPDTWVKIERLTGMPDYAGYQQISVGPACQG